MALRPKVSPDTFAIMSAICFAARLHIYKGEEDWCPNDEVQSSVEDASYLIEEMRYDIEGATNGNE